MRFLHETKIMFQVHSLSWQNLFACSCKAKVLTSWLTINWNLLSTLNATSIFLVSGFKNKEIETILHFKSVQLLLIMVNKDSALHGSCDYIWLIQVTWDYWFISKSVKLYHITGSKKWSFVLSPNFRDCITLRSHFRNSANYIFIMHFIYIPKYFQLKMYIRSSILEIISLWIFYYYSGLFFIFFYYTVSDNYAYNITAPIPIRVSSSFHYWLRTHKNRHISHRHVKLHSVS